MRQEAWSPTQGAGYFMCWCGYAQANAISRGGGRYVGVRMQPGSPARLFVINEFEIFEPGNLAQFL